MWYARAWDKYHNPYFEEFKTEEDRDAWVDKEAEEKQT